MDTARVGDGGSGGDGGKLERLRAELAEARAELGRASARLLAQRLELRQLEADAVRLRHRVAELVGDSIMGGTLAAYLERRDREAARAEAEAAAHERGAAGPELDPPALPRAPKAAGRGRRQVPR